MPPTSPSMGARSLLGAGEISLKGQPMASTCKTRQIPCMGAQAGASAMGPIVKGVIGAIKGASNGGPPHAHVQVVRIGVPKGSTKGNVDVKAAAAAFGKQLHKDEKWAKQFEKKMTPAQVKAGNKLMRALKDVAKASAAAQGGKQGSDVVKVTNKTPRSKAAGGSAIKVTKAQATAMQKDSLKRAKKLLHAVQYPADAEGQPATVSTKAAAGDATLVGQDPPRDATLVGQVLPGVASAQGGAMLGARPPVSVPVSAPVASAPFEPVEGQGFDPGMVIEELEAH